MPWVERHGLTLTPEMLRAAYEFLRATPPFRGWKLPPGGEVRFRVTKWRDKYGEHSIRDDGSGETIAMSGRIIGHTTTLMSVMAHEMIHVHMFRCGRKGAMHGPKFQRMAALVCRYHGFDTKAF